MNNNYNSNSEEVSLNSVTNYSQRRPTQNNSNLGLTIGAVALLCLLLGVGIANGSNSGVTVNNNGTSQR